MVAKLKLKGTLGHVRRWLKKLISFKLWFILINCIKEICSVNSVTSYKVFKSIINVAFTPSSAGVQMKTSLCTPVYRLFS
jgi:beta-lactamase regulating signal transducer with metallopeptidase domain